jgi:hypothetical protein
VAPTVRNKSAPPKWSKLWRDIPQPCDYFGAYTTEQLERMEPEIHGRCGARISRR